MNPVWALAILVGLSLGASVVLFKLLKSSAVVQTAKYQAGGALAGFVIIFSSLYFCYDRIEATHHQHLPEIIDGTIEPGMRAEDLPALPVSLSVSTNNPDSNGNFRLETPCTIDPELTELQVFVLREGKLISRRYLLSKHEMEKKLIFAAEDLALPGG